MKVKEEKEIKRNDRNGRKKIIVEINEEKELNGKMKGSGGLEEKKKKNKSEVMNGRIEIFKWERESIRKERIEKKGKGKI